MAAQIAEIAAPSGERNEDFARSLADGLARTPKHIPCKYFYDANGSALFDAICLLPEYYQTRTETALLRRHAEEISALIGPSCELVEFGAGSLRKSRIVLDALEKAAAYTAIDISGAYLKDCIARLAAEYPGLPSRPVVADFTQSLALAALPNVRKRAGFFPGSTIGNFSPDAAVALLAHMRRMLDGGGLLVGVDLIKDPQILHAAYNDSAGVTAAFNKNLLARANRELNADFDLDSFVHYAPYNSAAQRIEMYLVSLKRQTAHLPAGPVEFAAGEPIHTEDSHKYTIENFRELAVRAGFAPRAVWSDDKRLFSMHWLESR